MDRALASLSTTPASLDSLSLHKQMAAQEFAQLVAQYQKDIQALASSQQYRAAADVQEKLEELKRGSEQVKEHSPASAQALKSKEAAHEERARMVERYDAEIQALAVAGRYREAADKQTEKEEKLKNIGAAAVGTASGHGVPLSAVLFSDRVDVEALFEAQDRDLDGKLSWEGR